MALLVHRVTIVAAPLAALAVACSAFGVAPPSDTAADPDGATDGAPSISDGGFEGLPHVGDGGGDGGDPCFGATFCETFDTGSLEEIAARWDDRLNPAGLAIVTEGTRRALQSRVKNGTSARLTRSLGEIAPATEVMVRAVVKASPPTGSYELFTLDLSDGTGTFSDYEVKSQAGKLAVDGVVTATTVADGQWHTIELHVTRTNVSFVIDGTESSGQAADKPKAEFILKVGVFAPSPTDATVHIDFIRVDVKP